MRLSKRDKILLRVVVGLVLAFIYIPLLVILVEALNSSKILKWPPPGFTLSWFGKAFENESARQAHLDGPIAKALMAKASELLAEPPSIHKIEVLADKM